MDILSFSFLAKCCSISVSDKPYTKREFSKLKQEPDKFQEASAICAKINGYHYLKWSAKKEQEISQRSRKRKERSSEHETTACMTMCATNIADHRPTSIPHPTLKTITLCQSKQNLRKTIIKSAYLKKGHLFLDPLSLCRPL